MVVDLYTSPRAESAALVLIDVQHDFFAAGAPALIDGTAQVICRRSSIRVMGLGGLRWSALQLLSFTA